MPLGVAFQRIAWRIFVLIRTARRAYELVDSSYSKGGREKKSCTIWMSRMSFRNCCSPHRQVIEPELLELQMLFSNHLSSILRVSKSYWRNLTSNSIKNNCLDHRKVSGMRQQQTIGEWVIGEIISKSWLQNLENEPQFHSNSPEVYAQAAEIASHSGNVIILQEVSNKILLKICGTLKLKSLASTHFWKILWNC